MAAENLPHGLLAMAEAPYLAVSRGAPNRGSIDPGERYSIVRGIAVIPIAGMLCQYAQDDGTGYDWIKLNFLEALADSKAQAIALVIDSGGGEVAGCFDLVDLIYRSRAVKPLLAICSESAYSAAYALASACERVTVPRTGGVGSVGVIAQHRDVSGALRKTGIAVTLIHYGERKVDGNDMRPLSTDARILMQADVDAMGDLFVSTVARNRGLTPEEVQATQAATFMGAAGVAAGFADAVLSPDEAFLNLATQLENARIDNTKPNHRR